MTEVSAPSAAATGRRTQVASWVVVLLGSAAPRVVLDVVGAPVPTWLAWAQIGLLGATLVASTASATLRPVRHLAVALASIAALLELRPRLDLTWAPAQQLLGGTAFDARMQSEQTGKLLVAAALVGVLLAMGYRRRSMFLRLGDLRTPLRPVRWLGFPRPVPWSRFALQWGAYIAVAVAVAQYLSLRPTTAELEGVVPMLPGILVYAAFNAITEEVTYRVPLLATGEPTLGGRTALWQAAGYFGIAHFYGTPGGPAGVVLSIFMGWILAKGILETRGLFWSWWIHWLSDVAIFVLLATTLV
ncbi:CPBP family intramembrane metalloprotease [Actinotalea sp. M2MS4P-6]|uniref:CPBP family intramembrane glutamic endopeptidase n=1 Tax=Actinotalea sp. M2MS4P-6 TaxID=2983762 RepID=UPI0021E47868|nr:CPBP family intramembrane glutamic endopeptidase [Actinotalea sp. M2MS4P-6]MCV2393652.1 CPBP family intramembrane metalloprotease [Actinotalea sp. M2MS4P-6]